MRQRPAELKAHRRDRRRLRRRDRDRQHDRQPDAAQHDRARPAFGRDRQGVHRHFHVHNVGLNEELKHDWGRHPKRYSMTSYQEPSSSNSTRTPALKYAATFLPRSKSRKYSSLPNPTRIRSPASAAGPADKSFHTPSTSWNVLSAKVCTLALFAACTACPCCS